jgi:NAD(P)-dependent dehydrogenase (short-subunit alcohol dehydrogenase family)
MRLDGRAALVTGAGRGIGLAAAAALGDAGAHVTLVSRTLSEVQEAAAELCARGDTAEAIALDVTDVKSVAAFFDERPAFRIVVNNAGTNRPMPLVRVTETDYDAVLDLNLKGTFFVCQHAVKRMLAEAVRGSLIHLSSQMGHVGAPDRTLYCASKWAVEGMSKALAAELGPHGIRSNTIAPTFIETPLTQKFLAEPAFRRDVLAKIKLGRLGRVQDLMGAIVLLASDASALMTGTSIVIDGGWTAD